MQLLDTEAQDRCKTRMGAIRYRDDLIDMWIAARDVGVVLELAERARRVQEIIDEEWK